MQEIIDTITNCQLPIETIKNIETKLINLIDKESLYYEIDIAIHLIMLLHNKYVSNINIETLHTNMKNVIDLKTKMLRKYKDLTPDKYYKFSKSIKHLNNIIFYEYTDENCFHNIQHFGSSIKYFNLEDHIIIDFMNIIKIAKKNIFTKKIVNIVNKEILQNNL